MHWGGVAGEGSEHMIDGEGSELELHFVHTKKSSTQSGPQFAVVAVLAGIGQQRVSAGDPWQSIDPAGVVTCKAKVSIENFPFDCLLPENKDYYHYMGSLTTPPCTEDVAWFVLKDKIHVPHFYLEGLRKIQDEHGCFLARTFRSVQDLNDRVVSTPRD
jgi:carbonic anhydrase